MKAVYLREQRRLLSVCLSNCL